jgi:hypothetical protein
MPCGHPDHDPPPDRTDLTCEGAGLHPDEIRGLSPDQIRARLAHLLGPVQPLDEGAVALHELYESFQAAGFPEDRAFQLTSAFLFHALDRPAGS